MNKVARVAVEHASISFDRLFDYLVPDVYAESLAPGCRVLVPFGRGNKTRQGFVLETVDAPAAAATPGAKLKTLSAVLDEAPLLHLELRELCFWLAERTFCTLFEAAKAMLPPGLSLEVHEVYQVAPDHDPECPRALAKDEAAVFAYLAKRGGYVRRESAERALGLTPGGDVFARLLQKGLIVSSDEAQQRVRDATQRMVALAEGEEPTESLLPSPTQKQKAVLEVLETAGNAELRELCYLAGVTPAVIMTLEKKGVLRLYDKPAFRTPGPRYENDAAPEPIRLSPGQQACLASLKHEYEARSGRPSLLFGVTGSGKTSVYLSLIDEVLPAGGGVIVMVPEIALTPQTLSIFYARYQNRVAVFHSALSVGERMDEWKRVRSGEAQIAVGTRSAVFAPFERLSLIIMDEEQEHTYKSEQAPRFHARDVARFRCAYHGALLVLASATPSVASFAQAQAGRYNLCELTERFGDAVLPEVVVVDMSQRQNRGSAISSTLFELLEDNLKQRRQSILLLNRRGHNTFVACADCKEVVTCPSCSISLIYHSANGRLMCHYCGYSMPMTETCPSCSQPTLRSGGYGTQRAEQELLELFPEARILRMDADTTQSRYAYDEKFADFAAGRYDIMLGTQMVAKGLDFPNVTLVGVISVDQQLYNDDYMSTERTFDLLTQVVGRSGRGALAGKAVLQTLIPENEIIRLASMQDYRSFYNTEIALRRAMIYPPFCDLYTVVFVGEPETMVKNGAQWFLETLMQRNAGDYSDLKLIVLGPLPLRVMKVGGKYRYRLLIKCKNTVRMRSFLRELLVDFAQEKRFARVSAAADINPPRTN